MKTRLLNIRLSEEERLALDVLAKEEGLSVSSYVRRLIGFDTRGKGRPSADMPQAPEVEAKKVVPKTTDIKPVVYPLKNVKKTANSLSSERPFKSYTKAAQLGKKA